MSYSTATNVTTRTCRPSDGEATFVPWGVRCGDPASFNVFDDDGTLTVLTSKREVQVVGPLGVATFTNGVTLVPCGDRDAWRAARGFG